MTIKPMITAVALAGALVTGTAALAADTAPAADTSSDVQRATQRYLVGVTGMT
jgi:hypothetical protein